MDNNLKKLFDEYISECRHQRGLRPETVKGYMEVFRHFSRVMPEVTTTDSLTPEMIVEFFKRIQTRIRTVGKNTEISGLKNSTIKTYWSKLESFFQWLQMRGFLDANPLKKMKPPKVEYTDSRALKSEDIHKILTAITLHSGNALLLRRDTAMVHILFFCGLRKGELLGLRVEDIDLDRRQVFVRAETSKSKRNRRLPINPILLFHLKDYLEERKKRRYKTSALVVSDAHDGGLTPHGLKHWVKRLNHLSGVKFHLHRFRHSFATALEMKNVGAVKIQKLMGHTDPKMTMRYLRSIQTEDLEEDIAKMSIENLA